MKYQWKLFDIASGNEIVFPVGARRKIDVDVNPLDNGEIARDMWGNAVWMGDPAFWRHTISMSCQDQTVAPISKLWRGQKLRLESPKEQSVPGPNATLDTDAVPGTCYGVNADDEVVGEADPVDREVNIPGAVSIRYQPIFECMINSKADYDTQGAAAAGWSLEMEELGGGEEELGSAVEQVVATGGAVHDYTDADGLTWRCHVITEYDDFVISKGGTGDVEGIASGGAGGSHPSSSRSGGGGGAGQYYRNPVFKLEPGTYPIQIPAGGGGDGSDAVFLGVTCLGGGKGGSSDTSSVGYGAGGGGSTTYSRAPGWTFPCPTPWHRPGNRGGVARVHTDNHVSGGGGGVTQAGGDCIANFDNWSWNSGDEGLVSRDGGAGIFTDITGTPEYIGAGGGGTFGDGGIGGGGDGSRDSAGGDATNYGSGGGGTQHNTLNGGNGYQGRVVIRYRLYT